MRLHNGMAPSRTRVNAMHADSYRIDAQPIDEPARTAGSNLAKHACHDNDLLYL